MSNSKHAHFRYNILDKCFRRRERPMTFQEILDAVNEGIAELYPGEEISIRTLRDDIRLFRDSEKGFGAPVVVERYEGREVYIYSDPEFSIAKKGLLHDEQYLIDAAQQLLERYDGHPKYDKLSEALVLFQEEEGVSTITDYSKILFYDKNEAYEGLSYLKPMFLAIKNKNVFSEGELDEDSVVRNFRTTASDGKEYNTNFYNLDVIISVGYRVKSHRGTQFRIWATQRLREYIVKGFTLNDDLLKEASGGNYFEELLARIRDIRLSEKVFWRKVLDIYATSIDYDPKAESSIVFFKTIQNKMHWAAHGQTADEVIYSRIDAAKPYLGLSGSSRL